MKKFGYLLPIALMGAVPTGYLLGGAWNFLTPLLAYVVLPLLDLIVGDDNALESDGLSQHAGDDPVRQ